jgi:TonB-linked SusC/RagA family outer membrane protein
MDFKAVLKPDAPLLVFSPTMSWRRGLTKTLRVMKLTAILMTVVALHLSAKGVSQKITIHLKNTPLEQVFNQIKQQTDIAFIWDESIFEKTHPITINLTNASLEETLDACLKDQPLVYNIKDNLVEIQQKHFGTVNFTGKDVPLEQVFAIVKKQTGYTFVYYTETLQGAHKVTLDVKGLSVEEFLDLCLKGQPLTYKVIGQTVVIGRKEDKVVADIPAQNEDNYEIKGKITNEKGEPLGGASVMVKGTKKGTITDADGSFDLKNVEPGKILIITYAGYETQELAPGSTTNISLRMQLSNSPLDQVQVIAYGQTTQRLSVGDVSTINGEDISKQLVSNPILALEGQVPGLFITQGSGLPGNGITVTIQGLNSIQNGNNPFYVIDGVPYTSTLLPNLAGNVLPYPGMGSSGGSPFNYLNPSDIESISVLKDADATAIYGSRAANGAILITTKKGKAGQTQININARDGEGKITRQFKYLNTQQYLAMRNEAFTNDGASPQSYDYDVNGTWDTTRYTNWQKVLIGGTAHYSDVNGNISGGSANTQYLFGASYHRETNVFPGDFSDQKAAVHANITSTSSNQKFHFIFSGNYISDDNHLPDIDLTHTALELPPDAPALYNADGTLNWATNASGTPTFNNNPLALLNQLYLNKTNNLVSNAILSYKILDGLEIKSSFGYNNLQANEVTTFPFSSIAPQNWPYQTRNASYSNNNINTSIIEPQIRYVRNISRGRLEALIGSTVEQVNSNGNLLTGSGYNSDNSLTDINSAATISSNGSTISVYKYAALFGRVNYNWEEKYILSGSIRRDGSSRFGVADQLHDFWSIGAGWIFSKEGIFQQTSSILSFGKVRINYGTTGNDQIGNYQYLDLYNIFSAPVPYQNATGLMPVGLPNPYLEWETTKKLDLGLDLGFLKDRVTVTASYFLSRSSNQLLAEALPIITGFTTIEANFPAVVQNRGLELITNSINIKTKTFKWLTRLNLTIPQNTVVAFPGLAESAYASSLVIGQPIGIIKAYHFLGVDPETGLYQVADSHGKPTTTPNPLTDNTKLINLNPKFYGGLDNSFSYKGFSLQVVLQFVKHLGQNFAHGNLVPGVMGNQPVSVLARWQKPGDISPIQKFSQNFGNVIGPAINFLSSDAAYTDASYIRCKNLSLSWQLPVGRDKKATIENTSLFIQCQNLFTLTHYYGGDPETLSNGSLPPLRVIAFGLSIGLQ